MPEYEGTRVGRNLLKSRGGGGSSGGSSFSSSGSSGSSGSSSGSYGRSSSGSIRTSSTTSSRSSSSYAAVAFYASSRNNRYRSCSGNQNQNCDNEVLPPTECTYDDVEDTKELILDTISEDTLTSQERSAYEAVRANADSASVEDISTIEVTTTREFELMRDISCGPSGKLTWYGYNVYNGTTVESSAIYNSAVDDPNFLEHNITCSPPKARQDLCARVAAMPEYQMDVSECVQDQTLLGQCTEFYTYSAAASVHITPLVLLIVVLTHWVTSLASRH